MSAPTARLLVVDDDPMNRDMLSRRLARHGYEVTPAEDGYEALELASARSFDLVLLDVMMPGIDGFEVLKALRQSYPLHALPVVMATARDGSDSVVKALQLGANDYVTKPLDFDVLLARIQTQLALRLAVRPQSDIAEDDATIGPQDKPRPVLEIAPWRGPAQLSIGRYQLEEQIGRGGMGIVYLARDPALDRPVAVKMLRDEIAGESREARERFGREARAVARLSHHNIVTIFDVGEDGGRPFIVMEFLSGATLARIIADEQTLPVRRHLELIEQLSRGLAHAHDAGIVHRDIKPSNLMLTTDGVLKIVDFGIARLKARLTAQHETATHTVLGTLAYMAPEQLDGEPGDIRSDVFAVGAVFYELLSKRRARSVAGMLPRELLTHRPQPLAQVCPDIGAEVIAIVDRAMHPDPEKRYQHLGAMGQDLRAILARP